MDSRECNVACSSTVATGAADHAGGAVAVGCRPRHREGTGKLVVEDGFELFNPALVTLYTRN
jgi:hypothetical protein